MITLQRFLLSIFKPLAERGYTGAQFNLGGIYHEGFGVPQDYAKALYWYRKAATQGYAKAHNNLGLMYYKGQGVPQDYAKAVYWYRKASAQGDAKAQTSLGWMYYKGQGVVQDYIQAAKWIILAKGGGVKNTNKLLSLLESVMTPAQFAEAQHLANQWREVHHKQ